MAIDHRAVLQLAMDGKISWEKARQVLTDPFAPAYIVSGGAIMATPAPPPPGMAPANPAPQYAVQSCAGTATSWFIRHGKDPLYMLGERLRLDCRRHVPGELPPMIFPAKAFAHIHAFSDAEKVRVFYVKDGVSNVIEEEANIFPSDGLVAQFKLLLG